MELKEILQQQAEKTGAAPDSLRLDESGICRFVLNETTLLTVERVAEEQAFYLYGIIDTIFPGEGEGLFAEILEANLFNKETGGATLAFAWVLSSGPEPGGGAAARLAAAGLDFPLSNAWRKSSADNLPAGFVSLAGPAPAAWLSKTTVFSLAGASSKITVFSSL